MGGSWWHQRRRNTTLCRGLAGCIATLTLEPSIFHYAQKAKEVNFTSVASLGSIALGVLQCRHLLEAFSFKAGSRDSEPSV